MFVSTCARRRPPSQRVTFSGNENAFVSGVATVISAIEDALEVESTSVQILTRGGMGSATVTIKEAFASAFTAGGGYAVDARGGAG